VYCRPNSWSGLDIQRLRRESPETYKKFHVERPTGKKKLQVYPVKARAR
jgi:hypothetical protein